MVSVQLLVIAAELFEPDKARLMSLMGIPSDSIMVAGKRLRVEHRHLGSFAARIQSQNEVHDRPV